MIRTYLYSYKINLLFFVMALVACRKVEYTAMDSPAYLRIFNSVNDLQLMENKNNVRYPYFCVLINPDFDASGIPVSAEITADYLAQRESYGAPYPTHIGDDGSVTNTEYPGKEHVLTGPILNGFDLNRWAQMPSGKTHVVFYYRPVDDRPFLDLPAAERSYVFADTTIQMQAGEVYTLHALIKDFGSKSGGLVLRQETFHKQAFDEEQVYVNFYNYTAKGFLEAPLRQKVAPGTVPLDYFELGIHDDMDIYLSLYQGQERDLNTGERYGRKNLVTLLNDSLADPAFDRRYLTNLRHDNFSGDIAPYVSFPLWINDRDDHIYTDQWQRIYFLSPGMNVQQLVYHEYGEASSIANPNNSNGGLLSDPQGNFAMVNFLEKDILLRKWNYPIGNTTIDAYHTGVGLPNLLVNTHSGGYNPRSFAPVNTVEIINGRVYLTTVQRRYDPPVYE